MLKILAVLGTRPEAIKMAPVIKEIHRYHLKFVCRVCVTGQHREMLNLFLQLFHIKPDYDLRIMKKNQTIEYITETILKRLGKILEDEHPDFLLVQGDTTTAMIASLAAFYKKVKIAHIEAGLRTWDKLHPYPEEVNRRIIDSVSDLFFAHTKQAKNNLIAEGVPKEKIEVTGNTVIDALVGMLKMHFSFKKSKLAKIPFSSRRIILVTAHRRENFGQPLTNICTAIKDIALKYSSDVYFIYPVHLNPNVQEGVYSILKGIDNVLLTAPLDYHSFVQLMKKSYFILTDSGGLQEEAPSLHKPVLLLREVSERPEAVKAGTVEIIGTQYKKIVAAVKKLLEDKKKYMRMAKAINPYGDGRASKRIVARLIKETKKYA